VATSEDQLNAMAVVGGKSGLIAEAAKEAATAAANTGETPDFISPSSDESAEIKANIAERIRWQEQCLLASKLAPFAEQRAKFQRDYKYITVVEAQPGQGPEFANRLNRVPGSEEFVDIDTYSTNLGCTPFINLSKVLYTTNEGESSPVFMTEVPLWFEDMAKKDVEDWRSGTSVKFGTTGAPDFKYENRPMTGYGIKSFEWRYVGSNPETVRNDIEATLVMEFDNFNQIAKLRSWTDPDGNVYDYSLLDLLGYGPNSDRATKPGQEDNYVPQWFEIKAVVGWNDFNFEPRTTFFNKERADNLTKAVKAQKEVLYLTLIDHDFSISQVGTFSLTLTYRARLEALFTTTKTDVIMTQNTGQGAIKKINELIDKEQEKCGFEEIKRLQSERSKLMDEARTKSMMEAFTKMLGGVKTATDADQTSRLRHNEGTMKGLLSNNEYPSNTSQIFQYRVSEEDLIKFASGNLDNTVSQGLSPTTTGDTGLQSVIGSTSSAAGESDGLVEFRKGHISTAQGGYYPINFFYYGDLLELFAMRALSGENFLDTKIASGFSPEDADRCKIITGPFEYYVAGDVKSVNIADIPISVNSFVDYWYRNVTQPNKSVYKLLDFVRDSVDQLVMNALGEDCRKIGNMPIHGRLRTNFMSVPTKTSNADPLLSLARSAYNPANGSLKLEELNGDDGINQIKNPDYAVAMDVSTHFHYLVIFADQLASVTSEWNGIKADDAKKGIYHLEMPPPDQGSSRQELMVHQGILQSIEFQKTDQPYLREARFQKHDENPFVHLSNVYNIRATTLGNTIFYPGSYVFVNPVTFGTSLGLPTEGSQGDNPGSLSNVMGLGGYHIITSVTNKIGRDFTTQITALWDNNGSGRGVSKEMPGGANRCEEK
tara:strand:- start:61 stop:2706 length:2646 start_codon:yes stop_codon:yes gene_type:complete